MKNTSLKVTQIVLLLLACSCSFSGNSNKNVVAQLGNSVDGDNLELVETKEDGVVEIVSSQFQEYEDAVTNDPEIREDSIMDSSLVSAEDRNEVKEEVEKVINAEDKFEEYVVQPGDTLMILAFRMYRDVMMWKEIVKWNEDKLAGTTKIYPGNKLKIKVIDNNGDIWQPVGDPYLIMEGDSLMRVSQNVYSGTVKYWRDIWENNSLLIKDPNIIFAGFTLYYLPVEDVRQNRKEKRRLERKLERELASKKE